MIKSTHRFRDLQLLSGLSESHSLGPDVYEYTMVLPYFVVGIEVKEVSLNLACSAWEWLQTVKCVLFIRMVSICWI